MTLHAAWKMDTQGVAAARKEIALIKFFGAQVLHDVVDRALQAHGALGYSTDLPLEAMYRYARAARIYDGPDEVHRASVARQVLRGYEAPARRRPERARARPRARRPGAVRGPARGRHRQRLNDGAAARCPSRPGGRPGDAALHCRRCRPSREDPARRAARLLRGRRPRRADRRAGARALRRAGLRAQGDRPQQARRRAAARARRGVRRLRDRGPRGRHRRVLRPRRRAQRSRQRRRARACTRSTPPARWSPRSTSRPRSSPPTATRSCSSATPATRRSRARWARRPRTSC